jgi:hypothetical protein
MRGGFCVSGERIAAQSAGAVDYATLSPLAPTPATPRMARDGGGGAARRTTALGLSKSHICTRGPKITIASAGGLMRVAFAGAQMPSLKVEEEGDVSRRGVISSFSAKSRQRLRIELQLLSRRSLPFFCGLTYPNEWVFDPKLWKVHLRRFKMRFCRRWPDAGALWKLEKQKRGAPHFHLFVFGLSDYQKSALITWISDAWFWSVGSGDEKHFQAGTSVERLKSARAMVSYCAPYFSKEDQSWQNGELVGRYWGFIQRDNLPYSSVEEIECDAVQGQFVKRVARRFVRSMNRQRRVRILAKTACLPVDVAAAEMLSGRARVVRKLGVGRTIPKLRLRNLWTMNVFCDGAFWFRRLPDLLALAHA